MDTSLLGTLEIATNWTFARAISKIFSDVFSDIFSDAGGFSITAMGSVMCVKLSGKRKIEKRSPSRCSRCQMYWHAKKQVPDPIGLP